MTERYFVDQPIEQAASIELSGPEAHHLLHVMRAKVGAEVILFDGSGDQFAARVERLGPVPPRWPCSSGNRSIASCPLR